MLRNRVRPVVMGLFFLSSWAVNSQAQELNWAQKMFDKRSHDFGVVAVGADVRYRFKITNLYRDTVQITEVRTTCGCSAAKPTKYTLKSREEAYIEVTMDTRKFRHRKDSTLIVKFSLPPFYETVRIPVTTYIRTDVVLDPGAVNFGAVDQGTAATRKISIKYAGRNDWKIKEVKTNNKHITVKLIEKTRENGRVSYELETFLKPTAPAGRLSQLITLITDDANSPHIPILVEAKVEADVTVTVASSLGTVETGKSKTFNVVLKGKKPFTIEKIECSSDRQCFKIKLSKKARPVHVLPITFTAPEKAGEISEVFTVTITGRPQPLIFKTKAKVVAPKEAKVVAPKEAKVVAPKAAEAVIPKEEKSDAVKSASTSG